MNSTTKDRSGIHARASWFGRDGLRALVAGVCLGGLIALGIAVAGGPVTPKRVVAITAPHNDDDLTTGSIVFVPALGHRCRQRLIDNATWHIRDNGVVDCNTALSSRANARTHAWSAARVDVIRHGFQRR